MTTAKFRLALAQLLLGFAYLSVAFQWLWVLALGLPPLIDAGFFDSFISPTKAPEPTVQPTLDSPPLAVTIAAGVTTILFLIITVIVLIKLPKAVSKTGEAIVHQTANAIVPVISHNKKIAATKKRVLTQRVVLLLRLTLVLLPLLLALFLPPIDTVSRQVVLTIAIWTAIISSLLLATSLLVKPTTSRTRSRASRE